MTDLLTSLVVLSLIDLLIPFSHCILIRTACLRSDNLLFGEFVNTFQTLYFDMDCVSFFRQLVFDGFVNTFQPFHFVANSPSPFRQFIFHGFIEISFNHFILIRIAHHTVDNFDGFSYIFQPFYFDMDYASEMHIC